MILLLFLDFIFLLLLFILITFDCNDYRANDIITSYKYYLAIKATDESLKIKTK